MKWQPTPDPEQGAKRTIEKFAFLPTSIGPWTVWLEFYSQRQLWNGYHWRNILGGKDILS